MSDFNNMHNRRPLDEGQVFIGNKQEIYEEYDLKDPKQRAAGIRVILSIFLPLIIFCLPAAFLIIEEVSVLIPVILIAVGVLIGLISCINVVIYNKTHGVGNIDPQEIQSTYEIRSLVYIIAACITYIPFLCYILALVYAKKYPNCDWYKKGGINAQMFTLIWSLISLFCWGLIAVLFFFGVF